jgi:hypothetical protein
MQQWTDGQWTVAALTIVAGLAAAVLLWRVRSAVIGWTAPATYRAAHTSAPRPSLVLAAARTPLPDADFDAFKERWREAYRDGRPAVRVLDAAWTDPMRVDFTDPGIGALSSIQAIDVDPTLKTSAELHAELDAWVNAYADLTPLMPETAAAAEQMRIALEPARRTIELWRMRGEGGPARRALNDWRMDTPTGAFPIVVPVEA